MKIHDFSVKYPTKYEKSDHIVGERIRDAMALRGLTRNTLSELSGLSSRRIGLICNGHEICTKEELLMMRKFLNMPTEYFYSIHWERV